MSDVPDIIIAPYFPSHTHNEQLQINLEKFGGESEAEAAMLDEDEEMLESVKKQSLKDMTMALKKNIEKNKIVEEDDDEDEDDEALKAPVTEKAALLQAKRINRAVSTLSDDEEEDDPVVEVPEEQQLQPPEQPAQQQEPEEELDPELRRVIALSLQEFEQLRARIRQAQRAERRRQLQVPLGPPVMDDVAPQQRPPLKIVPRAPAPPPVQRPPQPNQQRVQLLEQQRQQPPQPQAQQQQRQEPQPQPVHRQPQPFQQLQQQMQLLAQQMRQPPQPQAQQRPEPPQPQPQAQPIQRQPQAQPPQDRRTPEQKVAVLVDMGIPAEAARATLEATNFNVEAAASLLLGD